IDVRLHRAALAGANIGHAGADIEHLHAELVSGDARITEERHLAEVAADVRAADAHLVHPHQRLTGPRPLRGGNRNGLPVLGGFGRQGLHCRTLSVLAGVPALASTPKSRIVYTDWKVPIPSLWRSSLAP